MSIEEDTAELVAMLSTMVEVASEPVFVALDGRSGAGKSTLASTTQSTLAEKGRAVAVIEGDQFYAGGSSATWDSRTPQEKVRNAMDWRRQHALLSALRRVGSGTWRSFDWEAPDWDVEPAPLEVAAQSLNIEGVEAVILEGAYSARPELHDVLDAFVLLDPPADIRRQQLLEREGDAYRADWEGRWAEAEDLYFDQVMTRDRFDLVIDND